MQGYLVIVLGVCLSFVAFACLARWSCQTLAPLVDPGTRRIFGSSDFVESGRGVELYSIHKRTNRVMIPLPFLVFFIVIGLGMIGLFVELELLFWASGVSMAWSFVMLCGMSFVHAVPYELAYRACRDNHPLWDRAHLVTGAIAAGAPVLAFLIAGIVHDLLPETTSDDRRGDVALFLPLFLGIVSGLVWKYNARGRMMEAYRWKKTNRQEEDAARES